MSKAPKLILLPPVDESLPGGPQTPERWSSIASNKLVRTAVTSLGALAFFAGNASSVAERDTFPGPAIDYQIRNLAAKAAVGEFNKKFILPLPLEQFNRQDLLRYHNYVRAAIGKKPLKLSPALDDSAQKRAEYLASHPADHSTDWQKLPFYNLELEQKVRQYNVVSESSIWLKGHPGSTNMPQMMEMWIESFPHYINMTSDIYDVVGFGDALSPDGQEILVAQFGGAN